MLLRLFKLSSYNRTKTRKKQQKKTVGGWIFGTKEKGEKRKENDGKPSEREGGRRGTRAIIIRSTWAIECESKEIVWNNYNLCTKHTTIEELWNDQKKVFSLWKSEEKASRCCSRHCCCSGWSNRFEPVGTKRRPTDSQNRTSKRIVCYDNAHNSRLFSQ